MARSMKPIVNTFADPQTHEAAVPEIPFLAPEVADPVTAVETVWV